MLNTHILTPAVVKDGSNSRPAIIHPLSVRQAVDSPSSIPPANILAQKIYSYLKTNCIGKEKAIKKPALAIALFNEATESNLRILRDATQWLSEQRNENGEGLPIGFSTYNGYYIITNSDELESYKKTCRGYAMSSLKRYSNAKRIRLKDDWYFNTKDFRQEKLF